MANNANNNSLFSRIFNARSWRLQTKMLVPMLLVVVLSLGITWATVTVITSNSLRSMSQTSLIELSESMTQDVSDRIEGVYKTVVLESEKNVGVNAIAETEKWDKAKKMAEYEKSLSFDSYKSTAASQNFYLTRAWLEQMIKVQGFSEIMFMDINGMTLCATEKLSDPNNATDDWFKEAVKNYKEKGQLCTVRGPEYDDSSDTFSIYFTAPVRRSGESIAHGWVSFRYSTDEAFASAITYNKKYNDQGLAKGIGWVSKDDVIVGLQERYRVGTNIGANRKFGKREIDYHLNVAKDWTEKDGKYFDNTGKEQLLQPSDLLVIKDNYKAKIGDYNNTIEGLNNTLKDILAKKDTTAEQAQQAQKDHDKAAADARDALRQEAFGMGAASVGANRAYSVELLGGSSNLPDLGFVFTIEDTAVFNKPITNITFLMLIIMAILILLTVVLMVIIARTIVNPILILRGSLVEVSLGNYNIQVPVTSQDEVGDLATTFNQMLKDIRQYIVSDEERNVKDREISELIDTLSKLAAGDLSVRAEVPPDEIGALADSVNFLAEELQDKVQSEEAKDQQDRQIANLLSTVSEMSTGDMTQSAEVTADVLGAVADSVNYMGEQIRKILQDVSNVTLNISDTSSSIIEASDAMTKDAREQQSIITDTSAAVDEMAISINQVSQSAESAAQAAENSAKIAEVGGKTVEEAVDAMNRIRGSVAEISKRIKKLGESSQEIGEIVNVISDIAAQTNMLALNAAIEAARAGEQGRGFSVVADAVRQLAERSTKSTKDITLLIRGIQSETSEAIKTMEDSTGEVVEGSKLAETARDRLEEIVGNSRQLADLISSISLSSRQQSRATEEVNKSMGLISTITNSSTRSILNAAQSVAQMSKLVEELGVAIKRFKI